MENYINEDKVNDDMSNKVLIATIYSAEPVLAAANKLGPNRLILLIDEDPNKKQKESLALIKNSLGKVIDVKEVKTSVYDIVSVAKKVVELIDIQPREDAIYINLTSGRKTKALGLLFAAYARHSRVEKIAYNPEEDNNAVIYLPKLSFRLTKSQSEVLDIIAKSKDLSYSEMANKASISRAMLYRNIDDLRNMGLISAVDGLHLTEAGEIARL
jgi:CRISPR-associated protein Csa3